MGAEYVYYSIGNATDFNMPLQQLVTEYCWGEVLLQTAIDCGVPAAVDSFRTANRVFAEVEEESKGN